jgi:hypothetical protein
VGDSSPVIDLDPMAGIQSSSSVATGIIQIATGVAFDADIADTGRYWLNTGITSIVYQYCSTSIAAGCFILSKIIIYERHLIFTFLQLFKQYLIVDINPLQNEAY